MACAEQYALHADTLLHDNPRALRIQMQWDEETVGAASVSIPRS